MKLKSVSKASEYNVSFRLCRNVKKAVTVQLLEVPVGVIARHEVPKQSYKKAASSLSLLAVTRILPRAELLPKA